MYQAVARRTRSNKPWVVGGDLTMGRKRRKVDEDDDEVICLGENLEGKGAARENFASAAASSSSPYDMKNGFVYLGETEDNPDPDPEEVVDVEGHDGAEERIECYETKSFQVKEEERDEEGEGCSVAAVRGDKGESFDDDDDDEYGSKPEKPVVLLPHLFRGGRSSSDEGYDSLWSSTESEDVETSDDDFKVDEEEDDDDDVESEYSSSEESDSSEDDERRRYKMVKERVRKVVSESESSRVWRRKGERKNKHVEKESVEKWNGGDCASVASSKSEINKEETERAQENKQRANRVEDVNNADPEVLSDQGKSSALSVSSDDDALEDKEKGVRDHQRVFFQKETRYSSVINKCGENIKVKANAKETGHKDELHERLRMSSTTKNHCFEFFNECFRGKRDSAKDVSRDLDKKVGVGEGQTRPFDSRETISLNWNSMMKEKPVEKSESEQELDMLWEEMDMLLQAEKIGVQGDNTEIDESREIEQNSVPRCKHDTIFNEQIGIYCRWCGWIETEIKYITPPFIDSERYGRRVSSGGGNASRLDGVLFSDGEDSEAVRSHNHGTVWDLTPGIKESLFPHQQEGFEFIWENLAGTIELSKLKMVDPQSEGGCIVSHAPGTGKTRLTMVFLQTYLQVFPNCLPIIIAPANILLTWEDELRKWNIGIPFHNLNNAELSGKEHAIRGVDWLFNQQQKKDVIRMVKLCSWYKEKSILLISYNLYEKLAGGKSEGDGEKEKNNRKNGKQKKNRKIGKEKKRVETELGNVLRDYPDLLVLDEGHTPRNKRSCIWKVLSESRSQKRILLSGTPFQNNFLELYNILCLMKPSFPDSIPQELKKFLKNKLIQETKASKDDESWEPISAGNQADEKINQLKLLMNPFVHVHKGSILQKNLPGLRDCVLVLKPECLQKNILESIDCSQNALNFEHKLALASVHPSLFLNCALSKKEESVIDSELLKRIRLDSYQGVKTKFLIEFVRLCDAVNEKVLVFSQFIDTLCLIRDQLESAFNWSVGTDVLYMHGKLDQKQKQFLIHNFNDAKSQAKVLLASIKASSEGINLVGASRVVLVDVVWNPSVERQAICRAYRLGQKRVVYTYHLLAQGTPECAKYDKQSEKDRLSELVFSSRNVENDKLENVGVKFEDKVLDLMVQHNSLKDIFGQCLVQPKDRDLETLGP